VLLATPAYAQRLWVGGVGWHKLRQKRSDNETHDCQELRVAVATPHPPPVRGIDKYGKSLTTAASPVAEGEGVGVWGDP
jgi:hypothetical protein